MSSASQHRDKEESMSNRHKVSAVFAAAAGLSLSPVVNSQVTYIYNVGPNTINISATSCRATDRATEESKVTRQAGAVYVSSSTATKVYCPIQRRGTTFYGVSGGSNQAQMLDMGAITVKGMDNNQSASVFCEQFRKDFTTGSMAWGSTRYMCSIAGGCASAPAASWQGVSEMTVGSAGAASKTVNYGYRCTLSGGSALWHAEAVVTPNP